MSLQSEGDETAQNLTGIPYIYMSSLDQQKPGDRYLDASATAPLLAAAREAMERALDEGAANPSSVHSPGHRAAATVAAARTEIAAHFGVRPSNVVFTSGGTEANNLALSGLAIANPRGRHIVTTPLEHPSVLETCRYLERVFGFELTLLPVDAHGLVDPDDARRAVRPDTTLVSIGLANAEAGTVQPLAEIAAEVRALPGGAGVLLHTDAVQAAAQLPMSLGYIGTASGADYTWPGPNIDAMTIASHKFGGPQGAGALILRGGIAIEPLLHGGGQQGGVRSGTENVVGIAGFAAAVREVGQTIGARAVALAASRDLLVERVLGEVRGAALTGHPSERLPGHASFTFAGVSGESLLVALDAAGIAVSSGSACAAGHDEPSPALLAMGIEPQLAQSALRVSLAEPIDEQIIDLVVSSLAREVGRYSG